MRKDLDHLPPAKRDELDRIVATIFEEFRLVTGDATGKRRGGKILKIILFGSYSRDDWVDAPLSPNRYRSDYDLLVIVNQKDLTDRATYWGALEERLAREHVIEQSLSAPAVFIVHSLQQVNDGLAHGRVFFLEIAREGIVLYESDDRELHQPKPKTPRESLETAKEYLEDGIRNSQSFYKGFKHAVDDGDLKKAAFDLHQSTEQIYQCLMLTLTYYTPYNHNLTFLRSQAERLAPSLIGIWPSNTRNERAAFEKLKDAYTKARYSKHFKISPAELDWLGSRVAELGSEIRKICQDHVDVLERRCSISA